MEFWGVEVKAGENLLVELGEDRCIHLSQAALGEAKKDKKASAPVFVTVGDQKLVIGTLSSDNFPQISYDLVFDKDFKLSHGFKDGSVYFTGYVAITNDDGDDFDDDSSEDEEVPALAPIPANAAHGNNEKSAAAAVAVKPNAEVPNAKAKPVEPADVEDSDDSDEDEDDSEEEDSDEVMVGAEDDSSDEDDSSEEEEDATPQKVQNGAKRPAPSNSKTPVQEKKAKLVTPTGKSGAQVGKKNVHTATPYPTKQTGKTPANDGKGKQQQSPHSGKSNKKKFKSGGGGGSQPNKGKRN